MALTQKQISQADTRREKLVALCEELPEVDTQPVGERHLVFRVRGKSFGYYMCDHHNDGRIAFACKSTREEQHQLVADDPERFFLPAYLGADGWIAIRLDTGRVDWNTVAALARAAWKRQAPKRLAERP